MFLQFLFCLLNIFKEIQVLLIYNLSGHAGGCSYATTGEPKVRDQSCPVKRKHTVFLNSVRTCSDHVNGVCLACTPVKAPDAHAKHVYRVALT